MSGQGGDPTGASPGPDASPEDRLRFRAADALERGLGFVERHGDALAILRTHALLGARPVADCVARIAECFGGGEAATPLGLAAQGAPGLCDFAGDALAADWLACLEPLIALDDLGALGAPVVEEIAGRAQALQRADGSWGAADASAEQRLFATGMLAGHLARTRVVRPEVLDRAGAFLADRWSPDAVAGRSWPALAAFGAWFSSVGNQDELADGALQWVGRELERGFREGVYDAVHTVRVLLHCDASAVPGAGLAPGELLDRLLGEQGGDGGFAELAMGSDAVRVEPTFDAMLGAIRLCGVI